NEVEGIAQAITSLLRQNYPGELRILLIDDHSEDSTAILAAQTAASLNAAARITIRSAAPVPSGWTGKLWALNQGLEIATPAAANYFWFTDADIVHTPDTLQRLVSRAGQDHLDLTSLMVLLRAETFAERATIPAFLFFFLRPYPPQWIAKSTSRIAGAAGGCILLRRAALDRIGGLAAIRSEVIDDCALARAVKHTGGRIWMGVTRRSVSLRAYKTF